MIQMQMQMKHNNLKTSPPLLKTKTIRNSLLLIQQNLLKMKPKLRKSQISLSLKIKPPHQSRKRVIKQPKMRNSTPKRRRRKNSVRMMISSKRTTKALIIRI